MRWLQLDVTYKVLNTSAFDRKVSKPVRLIKMLALEL